VVDKIEVWPMKEAVKESLPFFKTIILAICPWRYEDVKERTTGNIMRYLFSFIFLTFFIAILLMLPTIAGFVNSGISHFNRLEVSFNTSMNSPLKIPQNAPVVTIDTSKSTAKLEEGWVFITDDNIYTRNIFGRIDKTPVGEYKNLLANEVVIVLLLILMMPSLLFIFYLAYAVKVIALVLLFTVLGFIIARIAKFDVLFLDILKVGMLSSTPMILIDLIRLPLSFDVYYGQYLVFLAFFIIGVIKVGDFDGAKPKHGKSKRGEYIDLSRNT